MSERISLPNSSAIKEWIQNNGYDVVSLESDSPRFFQSRFTPSAGPQVLFRVEHTYSLTPGQPLVTVKRNIRAANAEDALFRYIQRSRENNAGVDEHYVGFVTHLKPGASGQESISVMRLAAS